jgi:hypothetical protein
MLKFGRVTASVVLAVATIAGGTAAAQEHVTARADVLLYGDNTEFRNPFREGETIFGSTARVSADLELNERVTLSLGVVGNERFGGDRAFEQVRPIVALTVRGARSSFVFGAFPVRRWDAPIGPDLMGPHGLFPPLQRETLTFERPYEPGLRWTFRGNVIEHEMWLEWQRLNTPQHRERFDAGLNAALRPRAPLSFPVQLHVVHEGGQLFASGAVADSVAAAAGAKVGWTIATQARAALEAYGLVSRYVPDRAQPDRSRDGVGFFGRGSVERAGWRLHLLGWRGRNFVKDEGDPNYLSLRRDGSRYHGTRDYAEVGAARRFQLAPSASLEVSARYHRIERFYEYSYRVTSTINVAARLR